MRRQGHGQSILSPAVQTLVAAVVCLLSLLMSPFPAAALSPHLVISEFIVDVSGPESDSEMVELYNPTGMVWNIGGWDIAYKSAAGSSWNAISTIPTGDTIPAYGYYLIGGDKIRPPADWVDTSLGFASAGGHIALRNTSNVIIDKVGYGTANDPEGGAAPPAPGTDDALERRPGYNEPGGGNGYDSDNNLNDFLLRTEPQPQSRASAIEVPDYDTGTVAFSRTVFSTLAETANITVTDTDLNNKSSVAETTTVTVTSIADPTGIVLTVKENSSSSNAFSAATAGITLHLTLGSSSQSSGTLKVRASGDTITVTYADVAPYRTATAVATFAGVPEVRINEVMFDPTGTDGGNAWLELYNAGTTAADITGWTLTDEDAGEIMTMPSLTVPAGNFVVWYVDAAGTNETNFNDSVAHIYSGTATSVSLANTEDQVALYASTTRNANTIVDFVAYVADGYYDNPEDDSNAVLAGIWASDAFVDASGYTEGMSLCLRPDGDDSNHASDWELDATPTQGGSNSVITKPGTPAGLQAIAGDARVDLSWTAAVAGDLPVAGYNVYRRTVSTSYGSPLNDTYVVALEYADTDVVNSTTYYFRVRAFDEGNNGGDSSSEVSATPTQPPPPGTNVVINELMYDPAGAEPDCEWVELYNPTTDTVTLGNWTFSDGEGIYTIPAGTTVAANDYLVLGATAAAAGGQADLLYAAYDSGTISFANTSDNVLLRNSTGTLIDAMDFTSAWGGAAPKTLGRKYAGMPADDIYNWGQSTADSGTPGAVNDVDTLPPVITHTPVTMALTGNDLAISASATDSAGWYTAKDARLWYRTTGETAYTEVEMNGLYDRYTAIIPGNAITMAGLQYYLMVMDEANNRAWLPANQTETNPYSITVWADTYRVVINEIMYDPPANEPAMEWVELYNADTTAAINIGGWRFTDGEGVYVIPVGTIIAADSYLVLGNTDSAAGGKVDLIYGDSQTGQIVLSNLFGQPGADEVRLTLPDGMVIDEVVYNVVWGAANGNGPNNNSLEKLVSEGPNNDGNNWSYSMVKGGTPQALNSAHLVRDIWASSTELNLATGETTSISYRLTDACTVSVVIYDETHTLVRTLLDNEYQSVDTHSVSWDGKDIDGEKVIGIFTFEIAAENDAGRSCVASCNDVAMIALVHTATTSVYRASLGEFPIMNYYLSKPAYIEFLILKKGTSVVLNAFLDSIPRGGGEHHAVWDGRSDSAVLIASATVNSLEATALEGNVIITRVPLIISTLRTSPVAYFQPSQGNQSISYHINDTASVTVKIFTQSGAHVRDLVTDEAQAAGVQTLTWNGRDDSNNLCGNGIYVFRIMAIVGYEQASKCGEVCVNEF